MRRSRLSPGTKGFKPRTSRLKATGALQRGAELTRSAAKPKPPKRDPAEAKARAAVKARSQGRCEMCGRQPGQEMHHRQNRSQGGVWSPENLLHLCTPHHHQVTVNPSLACERGWSVRSTQNPADVPVWLAGKGWNYLLPDGGVRPVTQGEQLMANFKQYRRSQIAEMADWEPGFDMTGVSVSDVDHRAGSPKHGDKIARNPKNHDDKWLVAAAYAADNFEPVEDAA